jgi:hypothetical protein
VFVNGRERPVIMQDMRRRIERGDVEAERGEAIQVRALFLRRVCERWLTRGGVGNVRYSAGSGGEVRGRIRCEEKRQLLGFASVC